MAFYRGPNIITNGLVSSLDAANTKSYPGSGTVLTDLTGNQRSGSLLNGASFDSTYGGSISFDGVDDNINIPYFNLTTQSFAVDIWIKPSNNDQYLRGILSAADVWSSPKTPGWFIGYGLSSNNTINYGIVDSNLNEVVNKYSTGFVYNLEPNIAHNLTLVRNTITQTLDFYANGQLRSSDTVLSSVSLSGNKTTINTAHWQYSPPVKGNLFSIKIYNNIDLTSKDISQNYNAQKSRFGL